MPLVNLQLAEAKMKLEMNQRLFTFAATAFLTASCAATLSEAAAPTPLTASQAETIGVDAYLYLYPLVIMDVTRRQSINSKGNGRGPVNQFHNYPTYPPATDTSVVRTNYDTLYSIAYLDLSNGPVVVSPPDTAGAITCCRCSTCGRMCSPRPVGARREPQPGIFS